VQTKLVQALLEGINRDRDGEQTEIDTMRQIIGTFKDMGLKKPVTQMEGGLLQWVGEKNLQCYREDFEAKFLDWTDKYYVSKSANGVNTLNCPEYLRLIEACL
jgi:hypothetical protein